MTEDGYMTFTTISWPVGLHRKSIKRSYSYSKTMQRVPHICDTLQVMFDPLGGFQEKNMTVFGKI